MYRYRIEFAERDNFESATETTRWGRNVGPVRGTSFVDAMRRYRSISPHAMTGYYRNRLHPGEMVFAERDRVTVVMPGESPENDPTDDLT